MNESLLNTLNSLIANATPLVIAGIGETISERAGVINLALNGSILLSAMAGFAVALSFNSIALGLVAAMLVGALIALIVAFASIYLRQDQVAVGFVLTLLTADLATFLGKPYQNIAGPTVARFPLPFLAEIPIVGQIFFNHDAFVYFSYVLLIVTWFFFFRTGAGLALRAVGERPETAFARGTSVNRLRYFYTVLGGAFVGLAGASYSLSIKQGWSALPPMNGDGWIALAIVIFAGWHPMRVLFGAYLFAGLRSLASVIQRSPTIAIPIVLLNILPWFLMIVTLMLVSGGGTGRWLRFLPRPIRDALQGFLRSNPPAALGTRFEAD